MIALQYCHLLLDKCVFNKQQITFQILKKYSEILLNMRVNAYAIMNKGSQIKIEKKKEIHFCLLSFFCLSKP